VPGGLALKYRIADKLVFSKMQAALGGRLRFAVSGGAPLSPEIAEFFHAAGILILEGYGLTETCPVLTFNRPTHFKFGSVGQALPGIDVKIAPDGEILGRGGNIAKGYFKKPDATAEVFLSDGWFATGDIGRIDSDGFLFITDRKKDLIITAGGKNVAPQNLENALKSSRFVSQALAVGDRRPYITALITLAPDEVAASGRDPQEIVEELVAEVNRDRVRVEQIKRFKILDRDFTQEDGEVTPTLKLRRRVVHEHFEDEIDELYR